MEPTRAWRLRACPRCRGDLYREPAYREWVCLQCGYCRAYGPDPALAREVWWYRRRMA